MKIIIVQYDYEKLEQVNMVTIESETTKWKFEYKFHQAFEINIHAHNDVYFILFYFSFFYPFFSNCNICKMRSIPT